MPKRTYRFNFQLHYMLGFRNCSLTASSVSAYHITLICSSVISGGVEENEGHISIFNLWITQLHSATKGWMLDVFIEAIFSVEENMQICSHISPDFTDFSILPILESQHFSSAFSPASTTCFWSKSNRKERKKIFI